MHTSPERVPAYPRAALTALLGLVLSDDEKRLLQRELAHGAERLSLLIGLRSIVSARTRRLVSLDPALLDAALLELMHQCEPGAAPGPGGAP